jgi:hypothetical protein
MMRVIGTRQSCLYPATIMADGSPTVAALLAEQRALERRICGLAPRPHDALLVGEALLAFASREDTAFSGVASLLDPAVTQELASEHAQLAEDLQLLDWLVRTTPESPDVDVLTASLLSRMRTHIDRDGRLLTRAAALER